MKKLLALILASIFIASPSFAAVTANSAILCQTPNRGILQFTHSSTPATYATAYTAGSNGSKIDAIFVSNNDSATTHVMTCGMFNSGTQYASFSVTTASPSSGSYNSLSLLGSWIGVPFDQWGNPFLYLTSGDTLQCTFATTITSSDLVDVEVNACDF